MVVGSSGLDRHAIAHNRDGSQLIADGQPVVGCVVWGMTEGKPSGPHSAFPLLPAAAGYGTLSTEGTMKMLTLCTGPYLTAYPVPRARRG